MGLNRPVEHQPAQFSEIRSDTRLNPNSYPQRRPAPPISGRAIFVVGGCLLLIILAWVGFPIISAGFNTAYCAINDCDPSGPTVPWSTQLAVADEAALKVDKDALLDD